MPQQPERGEGLNPRVGSKSMWLMPQQPYVENGDSSTRNVLKTTKARNSCTSASARGWRSAELENAKVLQQHGTRALTAAKLAEARAVV